MTNPNDANPRRPLRLWPGVVGGALLLVRFVLPVVAPPDAAIVALMSGLLGTVIVLLWWLFFSRAPWLERLGAVALMAAGLFATFRVVHVSISGGMMGNMFFIYAPMTAAFALVIWAVLTRGMSDGRRRAALVVAVIAGCGVWALLRTDGTMAGGSQLAMRWAQTAEERLLAQTANEPLPVAPATPPAATSAATPPSDGGRVFRPGDDAGTKVPASKEPPVVTATVPEWPGFRGPRRDSVIRSVRIEPDWSKSPPVEIWRRPIGPGWSSFAVVGDLIYTQEQRGEHEMVTCYQLSTGKPVWMHRDAARFYESNAGTGPRATPTVSQNRVYTFGATGIVNVLEAGTGARVWSRNAATDTGAKLPGWGFSSSPLVVDDVVIIAVAGQLVGYDRATGAPRWTGEANGGGYSSPHLHTIDGIPQVLLQSGTGVTSVAPADGKVLWQHAWDAGSIVQPAMTAEGDLLINSMSMMGGEGMRRLTVKRVAEGPAPSGVEGWKVDERWTSRGLKPYFSDFVVHKGHAYGFDGAILASVDLTDGARKWKGGRYGEGQLVLLADQDLLLVLSEEGDLALVSATPDKFTEVARFAAIEGKTWNHPVLVGHILLVRNGEEMAAFKLR